jgi:hypothetical protein
MKFTESAVRSKGVANGKPIGVVGVKEARSGP